MIMSNCIAVESKFLFYEIHSVCHCVYVRYCTYPHSVCHCVCTCVTVRTVRTHIHCVYVTVRTVCTHIHCVTVCMLLYVPYVPTFNVSLCTLLYVPYVTTFNMSQCVRYCTYRMYPLSVSLCTLLYVPTLSVSLCVYVTVHTVRTHIQCVTVCLRTAYRSGAHQ